MINTGMTTEEFVSELEESFNKNYSKIDIRDLNEFFQDNNISSIGKRNLYNAIKFNHTSSQNIPTLPQIVKIYRDSKGDLSFSVSGDLHKESPLQQLKRAKDWPVERILNNCNRINKKQAEAGTDKLLSEEISFLVIWGKLLYVMPEFLERAKQKIIDNGNNELRNPVDLSDLSYYQKMAPISEDAEPKGKTVHVNEALKGAVR